jgi:hypothetical protein
MIDTSRDPLNRSKRVSVVRECEGCGLSFVDVYGRVRCEHVQTFNIMSVHFQYEALALHDSCFTETLFQH